jgi:hypothetical protein
MSPLYEVHEVCSVKYTSNEIEADDEDDAWQQYDSVIPLLQAGIPYDCERKMVEIDRNGVPINMGDR